MTNGLRLPGGKELSLLNDIRTHSFKTDKDLKNSIIRTSSFRDACINSYESRISCIQSYFANRKDDLLQVQLSDPNLSTKINRFFNLPENILVYSSPRKNSRIKSRDSKQGLEFTLNFQCYQLLKMKPILKPPTQYDPHGCSTLSYANIC